LRQFVEAADSLRADMRLPAVGETPENVVRLSDHRAKQRAPKRTAAEKIIQLLDT
jgi:hypothetical protein